MRGPVAPPQVPIALSRAEVFDDLVREAAEQLERRWPQLAEVRFAVQDVPPADEDPTSPDGVPLGRVVTEAHEGKGKIVVYRRPVEIRAKGRDERAALVHDVVVEQVAELLGLTPEAVDPRYGQED
ncbi:hypothetical protein AQ490_22870 [Wenjunlia vitaminophila]|uniref:Zinicin-like metallopeptidase n=1 Tax=Wenjunlia vitaminophila TaxID=76728 RepID=A0A0T6LRH2_WENVI|nr:hypothetical protein AQ490_22870 [Wenjunlia vitaminophila]